MLDLRVFIKTAGRHRFLPEAAKAIEVARQLAVKGAYHMSHALSRSPTDGVMEAMFSHGEPHVADNNCLNTAVCCCYGVHHLIYYFISMYVGRFAVWPSQR